jgi:hypothetical protein
MESPESTQEYPIGGGAAALGLAIESRAKSFDVPSLLAALSLFAARRRRGGLSPLPVRFRSEAPRGPRTSLIERIEISEQGVVVTANWGMLSGASPLPSYFLDLLSDPAIGDRLSGLFEAIDAGMLPSRFDAYGAGENGWRAGDSPEMRRSFLAIARPAAPAGLHWLFSRVFPELSVSVRRTALRARLRADDTILGSSALGTATLGGIARVPARGVDVVLRVTEQTTWIDEPWPEVSRRRLRLHVLPLLSCTDVRMRVFLVDPGSRGRLLLQAEGEDPGHLGFDPLVSARRPFVSILYEGRPFEGRTPG